MLVSIILTVSILTSLLVIIFGMALLRKQTNQPLHEKLGQTHEAMIQQFSQHQQRQQTLAHDLQTKLLEQYSDQQAKQTRNLNELKEQLKNEFSEYRHSFDKHQMESFKLLQDSLQKGINETRKQVIEALINNSDDIGKRVDKLTTETDKRLKEISGQVEKRLAEGFEKTTATFTDVLKRLALIDEAQKKITELSGNVVSLQEVLNDKRSRGAFGEVQLAGLIRNVMPENSFSFQHTLSNGKRGDCILFLPKPTGNLIIDAKFPLESFRKMLDIELAESDRRSAEQQFKRDISKHIQDIADKYIIPQETSDGAVMFIPAEAVFAEIHAHYPELVEKAQKQKVWMVSPTTMMAVLTTVRAVLKDEATRQQVHIIQEHLSALSKDFERFQGRMMKLEQHIGQAHEDVKKVHTSAKKITSRFEKIEKVEVASLDEPVAELLEEN